METEQTRLDGLFSDFMTGLEVCTEHMEKTFGVTGLNEQLFGFKQSMSRSKNLKASPAWQILETAYRYAVEGTPPPNGFAYDLGSDPGFVLARAAPFGGFPSKDWETVVAACCARINLDNGYETDPEELALLAGVDVRFVRDAISARELSAREDGKGEASVSPVSASRWLLRREDFKPTQARDVALPMGSVKTPLDFRSAIVLARERAGIDTAQAAVKAGHPMVNAAVLERLERGMFCMTIDAIVPVAAAYGLEGKEFEEAVMRVFFRGEAEWHSERK